mmetsp:Transcript_1919/g.4475  ORF Transcript_1919/g.4475 Transcript_1919/m.4475 type:complete len:85 (+) Transcript_1919:207-461(+)
MRSETTTAAAFATATMPFSHQHKQPNGRRSRTMALAIVCIMVLTIGNHNDGIIASAFSPSYHRVLSPVTRVQDVAISSSSSSIK